ncbi:MAG: hypothetical protein AMXMBFR57_14370 [Acidimicrobiia bacterium]
MNRRIVFLLTLTLWWPTGAAAAQEPSRPPAGQPRGITLAPGIDIPAGTADDVPGSASQGTQVSGGTRAQLTLRLAHRDTWFVRVTGYYYLDAASQRPWNPDFTYSFGYDNWRPGTVSLTYDNYGGNRIAPDTAGGEVVTRFDEGTISLGYKIPFPSALESLFPDDGERRWVSSVAVHVMPRFQQATRPDRGEWKRAASLGINLRFYRRLFVEGRAFVYPTDSQQQPWDPDFTYRFGWVDWRSRTLSVQYGNYSGHRWPGRSSQGTGGFRNGSVTVYLTSTW